MEPATADSQSTDILEWVRKTEQILWKLDVLLKTATETQLVSKQPLLQSVEDSKKVCLEIQ